jgi:hypothetical protein
MADYVKRFQAEMIGAAINLRTSKLCGKLAATYRKMPVAPDGTKLTITVRFIW